MKKTIPLKLFDYQKEGVARAVPILRERKFVIHGSEMGLGKSLMALATVRRMWEELPREDRKELHPILFATTTSTLHAMCNEYKTAFADMPNLKYFLHFGKDVIKDKVLPFDFNSETSVTACIITTINKLRTDFEKDTGVFGGSMFSVFILDEAHKMASLWTSSPAMMATAAFNVPCIYRIMLTGTPIPNDPENAQSLFMVAAPNAHFTSHAWWKERQYDLDHPDIMALFETTMVRYTKHDVETRFMKNKKLFPDPIREHINLTMSPLQSAIDMKLRLEASNECEKLFTLQSYVGKDNLKQHVFPKISMLRQCCVCISSIPSDWMQANFALYQELEEKCELSRFDYPDYWRKCVKGREFPDRTKHSSPWLELLDMNPKVLWLVNEICALLDDKKNPTDKLIFTSGFTTVLTKIQSWLVSLEVLPAKCLLFDGTLTALNRDKMIQRFSSDKDIEPEQRIMALSNRAGCCGLNLTASDRLIILDQSWTPAEASQLEARIARIGQKRVPRIKTLIMKQTEELQTTAGTADESLFRIQLRKLESQAGIISGVKCLIEGMKSASTTRTRLRATADEAEDLEYTWANEFLENILKQIPSMVGSSVLNKLQTVDDTSAGAPTDYVPGQQKGSRKRKRQGFNLSIPQLPQRMDLPTREGMHDPFNSLCFSFI